MKTKALVLAGLLSLSWIAQGNNPLVTIDDYSLAYFEKYSADRNVRVELERNLILAEASKYFREQKEVQVTTWNSAHKDYVHRTFKSEDQYLEFIKQQTLSNEVTGLVGRNFASWLANKIPGVSDIKEITAGVPDIMRAGTNGESSPSLADFRKKLNVIQEASRNSKDLTARLDNKAVGIRPQDKNFSSVLVLRKHQLNQSAINNQLAEEVVKTQKMLEEALLRVAELTEKTVPTPEQKLSAEAKADYIRKFEEVQQKSLALKNMGQLLMFTSNPDLQATGQYLSSAGEAYSLVSQLVDGRVIDSVTGQLVEMGALQTFNVYLAVANIGLNLLSQGNGGGMKAAVKAILQAINQLRQEMHSRFDRIESILKSMGYTLEDIKALQHLSLYKLNEINSLLSEQERMDIIRQENASLDHARFARTYRNCESYNQTREPLRQEFIQRLKEQCFDELIEILLHSSSQNEFSPRAQTVFRGDFFANEAQLIREIELTNPYGNLNLLTRYVDLLTEAHPSIRSQITAKHGNVFLTAPEGSFDSYPNIKIFQIFSEILGQTFTKYGSALPETREIITVGQADVLDASNSLSRLRKKSQRMNSAIQMMDEFGVKMITGRLFERLVEEAAQVISSIKRNHLVNHSKVNVDLATGGDRLLPKFQTHTTRLSAGGDQLFQRELYRMQSLQTSEKKKLESSPWPQMPGENSDFGVIIHRVHQNIPHDKDIRPGFNAFQQGLVRKMQEIYPQLGNYTIQIHSLSANRDEVIKDYLNAGCVPGRNIAHFEWVKMGHSQIGYCTWSTNSAITDGFTFKYKLTPNVPGGKTYYFIVTPQTVIFENRFLSLPENQAKLKSAFDQSEPELRKALDRVLLEVAIDARERYIKDLEAVTQNSPHILGHVANLQNCSNYVFDPSDKGQALNSEICGYLKNKRTTLQIVRNLMTVYQLDRVFSKEAETAVKTLTNSLALTPIENRDLGVIFSQYTTKQPSRGPRVPPKKEEQN